MYISRTGCFGFTPRGAAQDLVCSFADDRGVPTSDFRLRLSLDQIATMSKQLFGGIQDAAGIDDQVL